MMGSPRLRRWIHRLGFAAILLATFDLAIFRDIRGHFAIDRAGKAFTRTLPGPIAARPQGPMSQAALELLAQLPPPKLSGNSLRFVALPYLGADNFAIALSGGSGAAQGVLVVDHAWRRDSGRYASCAFILPSAEFDAVLARLDRLAPGWPGDAGYSDDAWARALGLSDDSWFGFERRQAGQVSSGLGSSAGHYAVIGEIIRRALAPRLGEIAALDRKWVGPDADAPMPASAHSSPRPALRIAPPPGRSGIAPAAGSSHGAVHPGPCVPGKTETGSA